MLNSCIEYCIENEHTVSVDTPTGCLACLYKSALPDSVTCETIHSIFQHPSINWYIIDEISQVSIPIFQHILNTIQVLILNHFLLFVVTLLNNNHFPLLLEMFIKSQILLLAHSFCQSFVHYHLLNNAALPIIVLLNFLSHILNSKPT